MRLDKYLKVSRLIKRRTIAKELADEEIIFRNGKKAKPSKEVKVGDVLTLYLGRRVLTVEVVALYEHASKEEAESMYKVLSSEVINPSEPS